MYFESIRYWISILRSWPFYYYDCPTLRWCKCFKQRFYLSRLKARYYHLTCHIHSLLSLCFRCTGWQSGPVRTQYHNTWPPSWRSSSKKPAECEEQRSNRALIRKNNLSFWVIPLLNLLKLNYSQGNAHPPLTSVGYNRVLLLLRGCSGGQELSAKQYVMHIWPSEPQLFQWCCSKNHDESES